MSERLLLRDSLHRWRALGAFGTPAYLSHLQLVAMLRAQRQPLLVRYFGRPQVAPDRQQLSFSTDSDGTPRQRHEMSADELAQAQARTAEVHAALNQLVAQLRREGHGTTTGNAVGAGASAASFASLLEQARRVPASGDFLYFVDGQPVIAFWGFEDAEQGGIDPSAPEHWQVAPAPAPVPAPAPEVAPVAPPAAVAPAVARRRWRWWSWLLLLLLLLLLALAALTYCSGDDSAPATQGREAGVPLDIPPGALERGDLAFLDGTWQLGAKRLQVYRDRPSNVIGSHRMVLRFDRKGGGRVYGVEREYGGKPAADCAGGLTAHTDGKKLYFETQTCAVRGGGETLAGSRYECVRQPDGRTLCFAVNSDGHKWEAPLRRLP